LEDGNWCNNFNVVASVSIFGEIPHPANKKEKEKSLGMKYKGIFWGKMAHLLPH
jgi:hypothetical protein